jgi:hypothetical protein
MANWCNNQIYFTGEESKVKEVKALFIEMQKTGIKTNQGQIPFFIKEVVQDWFFDIYANQDDDQISYSTKWSANTEDCILIAKHYGLNFELNYQEAGNNIYGKSVYTAGNDEAANYDLSNDYFEMYEFDEDNDIYKYEGEEYECEDDILEILFEKEFNFSY